MRRDYAPVFAKRADDIGTRPHVASRGIRERRANALLGGLGDGLPHPLIGEDGLVCQGSPRLLGSHAATF